MQGFLFLYIIDLDFYPAIFMCEIDLVGSF